MTILLPAALAAAVFLALVVNEARLSLNLALNHKRLALFPREVPVPQVLTAVPVSRDYSMFVPARGYPLDFAALARELLPTARRLAAVDDEIAGLLKARRRPSVTLRRARSRQSRLWEEIQCFCNDRVMSMSERLTLFTEVDRLLRDPRAALAAA